MSHPWTSKAGDVLGHRSKERSNKNVFLFCRRMHFTPSPALRARKDAVLAVLSLWALSGTVGWGQELTWLLHKVSFIGTHVTWPVATPPPAAILSALPSKAGLGQVV